MGSLERIEAMKALRKITGLRLRETKIAIDKLRSGAEAVVVRPAAVSHGDLEFMAEDLIREGFYCEVERSRERRGL